MKLKQYLFFLISMLSTAVAAEDVVGDTVETYPRRIVVEEGSGSWCGYCPRGIVGMETMAKRYANTFIGIVLHRQNDVLDGAENYSEITFGGYPRAHFCRKIMQAEPGLPQIENYSLSLYHKMTQKVTLTDWSLDASTRKLSVTSTVRFGQSHTDADYRLAYVLTEDNIAGMQNNYYSGGAKGEMGGWEEMDSYVSVSFQNVARGIYPSATGEKIASVIEAAKDYQYSTEITVPTTINNHSVNIDNVKLTVLLLDGATGEILNAHRVDPHTAAADWKDPVDVITPVEPSSGEEEKVDPTVESTFHFVNRNGQMVNTGHLFMSYTEENDFGDVSITDNNLMVKKFNEGDGKFFIRYEIEDIPDGTNLQICTNGSCKIADSEHAVGETPIGTLSYYGSSQVASHWAGEIRKGQSCTVRYTIINTSTGVDVEEESVRVRYCRADDKPVVSRGDHEDEDSLMHIFNLGEIRTYRLAVLVAPNEYYEMAGYSGDRETELKNIRTQIGDYVKDINKVFMRDFGVRFEWVDSASLYVKDSKEISWSDATSATAIHNQLGDIIDSKIGNDAYDIGMAFSTFSDAEGMASLCGAYNNPWKAHVVAKFRSYDSGKKTVEHELGHMFGTAHTDQSTIMSYYVTTHEVPYFAAKSIRAVRRALAQTPYYKDEDRKHLVGKVADANYNNFVTAEEVGRPAPVLDKTNIPRECTVPTGGMYQFDLKGETSVGTKLFRCDLDSTIAKDAYCWFYPLGANTTGHFEWTGDATSELATAPQAGSTWRFLMMLSNPADENDEDAVWGDNLPQYDYAYETLHFVDAKPLTVNKLTDYLWDYGYHQLVNLSWSYDEGIYEGAKVRILLSPDYGKTYPYVLKDNVSIGTNGEGSCQISMPKIEILRPSLDAKRPGNIKVEIIGNPLFSILQPDIETNGGLTISSDYTQTRVVFDPEVEDTVVVSSEEGMPEVPDVKAYYKNVGNSQTYPVTYAQTDNGDGTYLRTWTVKYNSSKTFQMQQVVVVRTATGCPNGLTPTLSKGEGAVYNTAGQRVEKADGVVIQNGKKIIMK